VQFVNHEANYLVVVFGYHANAISLAQTTQKIVFTPGKFKTIGFNRQYFGHVAANHPPNVNLVRLLNS
jgi:hypothetical protein